MQKYLERKIMKLLKERFDTLSDAIIAIIMTILVLEIQIPNSIEQLPQLAESVGLFFVSFIIVINFWFHRLELISYRDYTNLPSFVLDITAHGFLSLYPLAVKMLIGFDVKWISILLFGLLNLVTGLLLSFMAFLITKEERTDFTEEQLRILMTWQKRRMLLMGLIDLIILAISLLFNQFGIFFYILSPFIEFLFNSKDGEHFQNSLNGQKNYIEILELRYGRSKSKR